MVSRCSALSALVLIAVAANGAAIDADKQRPVSKVITLLKDMVGQLQKESETDQETYDAFNCWCETGLRDKTLSISSAEQSITDLAATIEGCEGNSARLNSEIEALNKEIAENNEALESATAMRKKELAEFTGEEKSAVTSIGSMKGAIDALAAHHAASLLQGKDQASLDAQEEKLLKAVVAVQTQVHQHSHMLSPAERKVVEAFVAAPEDALGARQRSGFLQQGTAAAHNPEYAPASGEIFGVLKGMKENFEKNLASSQSEETKSQSDYESLKAAKTSQIAAATQLLDEKTEMLANTDALNAQSEQDKKDTERVLEADQEFLANLKEKCATFTAEFHERSSTRALEITAVSKALAYLNSDDAKDLFARTFKSAFIQLRAHTVVARVTSAEPGLAQKEAAEKSEKVFGQVEDSVGDMVSKLEADKEEEIKLKDFCVDSLQKNERDTEEKKRNKADFEAKIAEQTALITKLLKEIKELEAQIADLRLNLKRAGEEREAAGSEFQRTVADQRATRKLLSGALSILKEFYEKGALMQTKTRVATGQPAGPPPPAGFKKYEKNSSSGGVMGMINQIIDDAKAMEDEALQGEEEAQIAYESFTKNTNENVVEAQQAIVKKTDWEAQTAEEKAQQEFELKTVNEELRELSSTNRDLHKKCDFVLANFDVTQKGRDDEIYSLKENIAIVRGAKVAAMKSALER